MQNKKLKMKNNRRNRELKITTALSSGLLRAPSSLLLALGALLFVLSVSAQAQQPKKIFRIGYLSERDPVEASTRLGAIREALRELGYVEGQNIASEYRYTDGKRDRAPELAVELVRLKVDIIVVAGGGNVDPSGQERDQDNSYRYGRRWDRSS